MADFKMTALKAAHSPYHMAAKYPALTACFLDDSIAEHEELPKISGVMTEMQH